MLLLDWIVVTATKSVEHKLEGNVVELRKGSGW